MMTGYTLTFEGGPTFGAWVIRTGTVPVATSLALSADDSPAARHWARRTLALREVTVSEWEPVVACTSYRAVTS